MSVKERLIEFAKTQEKSVRAFEIKSGLTIGYINAVRVSISPEKLQSIVLNYPRLNTEWLFTGVGDMLKDEKKSDAMLSEPLKKVIRAPLISQYAYAGYLAGYSDHVFMESQPIFTAKHSHNGGNYVAFEIRGDSMDDNSRNSICHGDIVLGCELRKEFWMSKLHIPKVFVIVHMEDGIIVKEIIEHNVETGDVLCHSWNKSSEYRDFTISLKDVAQMFYIKEISRDFKL